MIDFIGAGPGDPDLLTVRAARLIGAARVCLHAGSTVAPAILDLLPPSCTRIDTAPLDLDAIVDALRRAHAAGLPTVRLHSGDLAVHSAVAEQFERLDALGIPWRLHPGVPAYAAAAAALGCELTRPGIAQSLTVTRLPGRASPMGPDETPEWFARAGATVAVHLAGGRFGELAERLAPVLGADCPVAVVERATWPGERRWRATLGTLADALGPAPPARLAIALVGRALAADAAPEARSRLYAADYKRRFRP